ncbi:helix-turn-helix domain-containing protein [Enterococcus larvae]|nr:helix-turn-helix transcriptional regulator [Enterococcus larvae]
MGDRIKRLRIEQGLTQEELGNRVGLKRAAINKYEKGNVENMKRSIVEKMSSIFNVSPSYLMALEEPENNSDILSTYNKLNKKNQQATYDFAKERLREQETGEIRDFYSTRRVETLAAHSDDPNKEYTAEDIERINRRLDEIDRKHGKIKD